MSDVIKDEIDAFFAQGEREVDEFLDIIVDGYEELVHENRELAARVKELEEKLAYFDEMKESLSQSVILAQETAEKVKEAECCRRKAIKNCRRKNGSSIQ